jgi:beta-aspartyl-peptidase (threonine type)
LKTGYAVLAAQGDSLDAVREAVKVLEDSSLFNAGYGSELTQKGKIELDAAIMDGQSLKAGSVSGVSRLANPVEAAQRVIEYSMHVMLIGRHAELFARRHGMKLVDPSSLITAAQLKRWQELKSKKLLESEKHGTVGAVALDCRGNLAAATSTGGIMNKAPGRVGDSPIIGAGTYADNQTCAVSSTGQGEFFIRLVFAYDVAARLHYQKISLEEAGKQAMQRLNEAQGRGGFIAINRRGEVVMPFNTEAMYRGVIDAKGAETWIR